ncbi:MAG: sugar ABC transporter ATP-binding protein, partial [Planctomycetaceae bacterium]|nr:sugar ABC transporter ATP-binding protein [Planctomycetaceae bacterium]
KKAMAIEAAKVFKELHIDIDPNAPIKNLTVGYQQMVEIAKAVSKNSRILIMDEPSAVLTNAEVASLYEMVRKLKSRGVTIVYISHRMDEIFALSDRITVMRDGVKVQTLDTPDTNVDELIKLMVGRELKETFPPRTRSVSDKMVLEVEALCGNGLRDISFSLKKGEVLGFGGLIGSGRTELMELLFGVKRPDSGTIRLHGKPIQSRTPGDAIKQGIALVPEDRKRQGAHLEMQIDQNISIAILKSISTRTVVNKKTEDNISERYRESLRIKTPSVKQKIKNLSGGNQQKVILAKWLATNPDLIIFDEPTRGIDVGAKYEIYKLMNSLIEEGKTIIMISSEMEELIGMSDRILVLHDGKITGELDNAEFSQEAIMNFASGVA